jgi:glycosyltransferase 2 family protein
MEITRFPIRKWFPQGLSLILVFSLASAGYLLYNSAASGLKIDFRHFNYFALGLAILTLLGSWLIEGTRISLIITGLGEKVSFFKILGINLATAFSGNVTPFYSGGIPIQIYLLCKSGISPGKSSAIVTLRVILSTLIFTILTPFLLLFYHMKLTHGIMRRITMTAIPIAFIFSGLLLLFIIKPKITQNLFAFLVKLVKITRIQKHLQPFMAKLLAEIETFHNSIKEFRKGIYFYLAFLFSLLYWTCFFSIAPFLMYACGINIAQRFFQIIFFQFILVFVIAYIPVPSGSGVMELGFYSVFRFIPPQLRVLFIFCWRLLSYHMVTLVGGIIILKLIKRQNRQPVVLPE